MIKIYVDMIGNNSYSLTVISKKPFKKKQELRYLCCYNTSLEKVKEGIYRTFVRFSRKHDIEFYCENEIMGSFFKPDNNIYSDSELRKFLSKKGYKDGK